MLLLQTLLQPLPVHTPASIWNRLSSLNGGLEKTLGGRTWDEMARLAVDQDRSAGKSEQCMCAVGQLGIGTGMASWAVTNYSRRPSRSAGAVVTKNTHLKL